MRNQVITNLGIQLIGRIQHQQVWSLMNYRLSHSSSRVVCGDSGVGCKDLAIQTRMTGSVEEVSEIQRGHVDIRQPAECTVNPCH